MLYYKLKNEYCANELFIFGKKYMNQQTFKAVPITSKIYWVGAIDWSLRDFHGYQTSRGTSYNAYLVLGDQPILIDTVKAPFFHEMLARISSVIDPHEIKYIISNHAEMDHSGCLPQMIELAHPEKIFASKAGVSALEEHFHFPPQTITPIKHNEPFSLGNITFNCIETKMLHWPDSMFTYCADERILFSQDAFGMHLATSQIFNENNDIGVIKYEATKYFANILSPYSMLVDKLISNLGQFKLDYDFIAPAHGPIWHNKNGTDYIIGLWQQLAKQSFYPKIVIAYDTMWGSTAKMAAAIADGAAALHIDTKVMPLSGTHRSDISTELLEAGALIIGSPTLNQEILPTIADTLCYLRGLKFKNLLGQVFGSYGWAGESINILQQEFNKMAIEMIAEPVKCKYTPTEDTIKNCINMGRAVATNLHNKLNLQ